MSENELGGQDVAADRPVAPAGPQATAEAKAGARLFWALFHHPKAADLLKDASPGFLKAYLQAQMVFAGTLAEDPEDDDDDDDGLAASTERDPACTEMNAEGVMCYLRASQHPRLRTRVEHEAVPPGKGYRVQWWTDAPPVVSRDATAPAAAASATQSAQDAPARGTDTPGASGGAQRAAPGRPVVSGPEVFHAALDVAANGRTPIAARRALGREALLAAREALLVEVARLNGRLERANERIVSLVRQRDGLFTKRNRLEQVCEELAHHVDDTVLAEVWPERSDWMQSADRD